MYYLLGIGILMTVCIGFTEAVIKAKLPAPTIMAFMLILYPAVGSLLMILITGFFKEVM